MAAGPADATPGSPDGRADVADGNQADATPGFPDARTIDTAALPDAPPSCMAAASYPDVVFTPEDQQGAVATDTLGMRYWDWMGIMGAGTEAALVEIQLYPGYGIFSTDSVPHAGTFTIAGEEASYATCGVCVLLYSDLVYDAFGAVIDANEVYLASAGSVTIDRVDTGATGEIDGGVDASPIDAPADARMTGSFASVSFRELDSLTGEPLLGGCQSAATHGAFDAALDPGP